MRYVFDPFIPRENRLSQALTRYAPVDLGGVSTFRRRQRATPPLRELLRRVKHRLLNEPFEGEPVECVGESPSGTSNDIDACAAILIESKHRSPMAPAEPRAMSPSLSGVDGNAPGVVCGRYE